MINLLIVLVVLLYDLCVLCLGCYMVVNHGWWPWILLFCFWCGFRIDNTNNQSDVEVNQDE